MVGFASAGVIELTAGAEETVTGEPCEPGPVKLMLDKGTSVAESKNRTCRVGSDERLGTRLNDPPWTAWSGRLNRSSSLPAGEGGTWSVSTPPTSFNVPA